MAENPFLTDSDYLDDPLPEGPGDGEKPKKKKKAQDASAKAQVNTDEVPEWAKGKTVGDLPTEFDQSKVKLPRKKRDFASQEKAMKNYADNDNVLKSNPGFALGPGGMNARLANEINVQKQTAQKRKTELQQNVDFYNAMNNDYVEDFINYNLGGIDDILNGGDKFSQFVVNTNQGLQVSDAAIKRLIDTEVRMQGGGNYTSAFYYSQIKGVANQLLALWQERDAVRKELSTLQTKYSGYSESILQQRQTLLAEGKNKVETARELSNQKIAQIRQRYEPVVSDLAMDLQFFYKQTAEEVGNAVLQEMEGITGVSPTYVQAKMSEAIDAEFQNRYGAYMEENVQPVIDAYVGSVNEEIKKANAAVDRITKQQEASFIQYRNRVAAQSEQDKQKANNEAAAIIDKYIKQGMSRQQAYRQGFTATMMNMSALPIVGNSYVGKLFGESFMAGLGRLRTNTATFLKSVGFEADWIDEMQYGGMSAQQEYSMGDAGLREFGLTPGYWVKALGESAPTMIPGILLSALTRNPSVGMIVGGVSEGADIAGGITNQIIEETGDYGTAAAKGREAFVKNIPTYFLEAPVHRLAAGLAGKTGKSMLLNMGAAGVGGGAQEWLQTGAIELPATENISMGEGLMSKEAVDAGITGMGMEMMMGGAGVALNTLFTKVPNARTQIITNSIIRHGVKGAVGAVQQEALGENETVLQKGVDEITKIEGMMKDAEVLELPGPQTQVYTALRQELSVLEEKRAAVKDPVLQELVDKQVQEKKTEIENVVSGKEKLATIELPMGLVFTGTVPRIGEMLQLEEIKEGIASGEIRIETEDGKLQKEVGKIMQVDSPQSIVDGENTAPVVDYDEVIDALVIARPNVPGLYGKFVEQVTNPDQQQFVAEAVVDQYEQDFEAASERYGEEVTKAVAPLLKKVDSPQSIVDGKAPADVVNSQQEQGEDVENKQQPVEPIRQLGNGSNVYFETEKYRVNDQYNKPGVLLNIGAEGDVMPLANIEFDNANEAVFVANKLNEYRPDGLTKEYNIDGIVKTLKEEYQTSLQNNTPSGIKPTETTETIPERVQFSQDKPDVADTKKSETPKKPKKVKLTYRQRTNELIDKVAKARNESNKTVKAQMVNEIKLEVAAINKSFKAGYKFDQKVVRLLSANGKRVVKRNEVTNNAVARDFDRANYSEATNQLIDRVVNDETLATGLQMTGVDGRRLSVEQMQKTIQSIRDGKPTEGARELFDYMEQAVNDGFVEIESDGMRAKVSVDEYFAAAKEVEALYEAGELPMEEAAILDWLAEEAANDYEETNFDNIDNLESYEPDITTTGSQPEQQPQTESSDGERTEGEEGADIDEAPPADDTGTGEERKAFLEKVAKDFDTYNLLPKKSRPSKLNAMSKRLLAAKRDGIITEEDFNDIEGRINADYEALNSDVRVQQVAVGEDVSAEFEGEGDEAKISNKEKAKEVADKIRGLRIANDKLYGGFLGLPVAAYNGLLSAVALTIEGGETIADAIKNGYEAVKPYLTGEKFSQKEVKEAIAAELQNLGIAARKKTISPKKAINEQLRNSPKTGTVTLRELFKRRVKTEKDMGKLVNELQQAVTDIFKATIGTDLSKGRVGAVMEALQGLTNLKDPELALLDVLEDIEAIVREQQSADLVQQTNANLKKLQKQFKRSGTITQRYKNFYKSLEFPRARKVLLATGAATLQQYNNLLDQLANATSAKQMMRADSMEQVQNKLNELNKLIADYDQQRLYDKIDVLYKKGIFSPVLVDGSIDMEQSAQKYLAEREAEGSELEKKAAETKETVLRTYLPELQKEVSKEIENIEDKRLQKEAAELVKVDVAKLDASELSELNDLLNNVLLDHSPDGVGNFLGRVNAKQDMQNIVAKAKDMVVRPINKATLEKKSLNALFQSLFYNEKAWSYFRSIVYQPWVMAANKVKAAMNGDKRRMGVAQEAEAIVKKNKLGTMEFYRTEMYKFINRYNPAFPESREEQQQAAIEKLTDQIQNIYAEGVRNMNGQKETFDSKKMKAEALQQAESAKSLGIITAYTETFSGLEILPNEDFVNDDANLTEGEKAWVDFTYNKFSELADDAEYSARSNFGQDFQREESYTPFIPIRIAMDNNAAADAKVDGSISTFTDFGKKLSKQPTDRFKKRGRLAGDDMYYGMNGLENFYNGYYQTLFAIEGGRELIQTTSIINGNEFAKFVNGSYNPVFGEKNFGRGEQAELIRAKLSQVYKGYKYAPFKFTTTQDYENTVGQWVYSKMIETMVSSIDQIFKQPLPGMVQGSIDIGPKYMAHALKIIMQGFGSREQADLLNQFFDATSEEFRDAQSLDSFHKVVDEQNRPAWQSVAEVPFTVFNYVGKKALVWADKNVLNRILLMAGYLKGLQENGRLNDLSAFDLAAETAEPDLMALSTAEGTAQRINATSAKQEKADVVKMGQHKSWWDFGYTLRGFQLDAWNNFRNNLAIAFDRSGYLGAADPQRYAALKRAAAYITQAAAYQTLVIWGTGMAWTALGQLAAEALMGAPPPDDDEKEKEKNTRRVLRLGSSVIADAFLGGQSVYVDAGVKVLANKLWEGYQDAYKQVDGGKSSDYKGGIYDSRLKPFYVEESQAAGPMAAMRYIDGVTDAIKVSKSTSMDPKARELKDRLEKVQLALLLLNAGDLQKLNNYTIKALNDYGKESSKKQSGMKQNMMKGGMLKPPKF